MKKIVSQPMRDRPIVQRNPPARDPAYLARVRQLPCAYCGRRGPSAAHHAIGPGFNRGASQKASDYDAMPLCQILDGVYGGCHGIVHSKHPAAAEIKAAQRRMIAETREALGHEQ